MSNDITKNDIPEIGALADELVYEEMGALVTDTSKLARSLGAVGSALAGGKVTGLGPVTVDRLASMVDEHERELNDIMRRLAKVQAAPTMSAVRPMGQPGLRKAAQAEPFGSGATAIANAANADITLMNDKGYDVDLADLVVECYSSVDGVRIPMELTNMRINGDIYGNGSAIPSSVFDMDATSRPVLNRRLKNNGSVKFNAANNSGVAGRIVASGTVYPVAG